MIFAQIVIIYTLLLKKKENIQKKKKKRKNLERDGGFFPAHLLILTGSNEYKSSKPNLCVSATIFQITSRDSHLV